jgi:hypothetical protein
MKFISEAAKKTSDWMLQGLVDGMERNNYEIFEDVDCMPKPMRIVADSISVSYMMLHSHNLGERIFDEEEIKKQQYLYENGIILLKSFLSERGFLSFLEKCEEEINHHKKTKDFVSNFNDET